MEREEVPLRAMNRQDTLESQHERPLPGILARLVGTNNDNAHPPKSGPVTDIIDKMARRYNRNPRGFLQDFRHMSRLRNARLHETFDMFIRLPHSAVDSNETAAGSIEIATASNEATAQYNEGAARSNTIISRLLWFSCPQFSD